MSSSSQPPQTQTHTQTKTQTNEDEPIYFGPFEVTNQVSESIHLRISTAFCEMPSSPQLTFHPPPLPTTFF